MEMDVAALDKIVKSAAGSLAIGLDGLKDPTGRCL